MTCCPSRSERYFVSWQVPLTKSFALEMIIRNAFLRFLCLTFVLHNISLHCFVEMLFKVNCDSVGCVVVVEFRVVLRIGIRRVQGVFLRSFS